jgi:hypothetical protein
MNFDTTINHQQREKRKRKETNKKKTPTSDRKPNKGK